MKTPSILLAYGSKPALSEP